MPHVLTHGNLFGFGFLRAPVWRLRAAFHSITGLYWHTRLAGYEVDDIEFGRRSYGNSVAIGRNLSKIEELSPILARLTEKMCSRLRAAGYRASGIHLMLPIKTAPGGTRGVSCLSPRLIQGTFIERF